MNNEVTIYHNPKCSKSRKALEIIKSKNIEPTIILYLASKLSKTEVKNLLAKLGLPIRDILRTGEDEYKNNNLNNENLYFDANYLESTYDILNSLKLGCEYTIYNEFDLRMGYNDYFYTIGIGTKIYNILFDYTYLYHQDLDQSHQFTISFLIKNK